jgi:heme/copper-type cytochrome/quinol oxidase subunit 2
MPNISTTQIGSDPLKLTNFIIVIVFIVIILIVVIIAVFIVVVLMEEIGHDGVGQIGHQKSLQPFSLFGCLQLTRLF